METLPNEIIDLIVNTLPMRDFYALWRASKVLRDILVQIYGNLLPESVTQKHYYNNVQHIKKYIRYSCKVHASEFVDGAVKHSSYSGTNFKYNNDIIDKVYVTISSRLVIYSQGKEFAYSINFIANETLHAVPPVRNRLFISGIDDRFTRILFIIYEHLGITSYEYRKAASKLRNYRAVSRQKI
jgi:hypothetical protein